MNAPFLQQMAEARAGAPRSREPAPVIQHSWALSEWTERAPGIYPGNTEKAKYLVRVHKRELLECGALSRIGRELIVFGQPYVRWLAKKAVRVPGYQIAANSKTSVKESVGGA